MRDFSYIEHLKITRDVPTGAGGSIDGNECPARPRAAMGRGLGARGKWDGDGDESRGGVGKEGRRGEKS